MNENIKALLKLVIDNPDLPIVPMVDYEICADDSHSWWMGSFGGCKVTEYTRYDDAIYMREDQEALENCFYEQVEDDLTSREAMIYAHNQAESLNWIKAIAVHIDLP